MSAKLSIYRNSKGFFYFLPKRKQRRVRITLSYVALRNSSSNPVARCNLEVLLQEFRYSKAEAHFSRICISAFANAGKNSNLPERPFSEFGSIFIAPLGHPNFHSKRCQKRKFSSMSSIVPVLVWLPNLVALILIFGNFSCFPQFCPFNSVWNKQNKSHIC